MDHHDPGHDDPEGVLKPAGPDVSTGVWAAAVVVVVVAIVVVWICRGGAPAWSGVGQMLGRAFFRFLHWAEWVPAVVAFAIAAYCLIRGSGAAAIFFALIGFLLLVALKDAGPALHWLDQFNFDPHGIWTSG